MKRTTTPPPVGDADADVAVDPFGLDAAATLAFVVDRRRRQDQAAAEELRGVTQWADLHRVTDGTIGSIDDDLVEMICPLTPVTPGGHDRLLGREGQLRVAGQGAFMVTEFAVCELAAALSLSEPAARSYLGQGVELRDRLPRLWTAVMAGRLPAWKARKIAEQTLPLTAAAAAYVDAHLAPFAHRLSLVRITRAVDAAILRHDPDEAAARAAKAAEGRGVWVDDDLDGTSRITAVTTTPDAAAFEAAVHDVATDLAALGSTAPEQVRRATAVGVLADPQYALDLHQAVLDAPNAPTASTKPAPRKHAVTPTLHVHLHTDAVAGLTPPGITPPGVTTTGGTPTTGTGQV